jgi:hypothetical protein
LHNVCWYAIISIQEKELIGLNGKSSREISREYNVSPARVRQWAMQNNIPYIGTEDRVEYYVFDEEAEERFRNRKTDPGRPPQPKLPKIPGKPGRPRKEKPVNIGPKRPVGRPRKNPPDDIIKLPGKRGRPRKEK